MRRAGLTPRARDRPRRIRAPHDDGEAQKGLELGQPELLDHHVESAEIVPVRPKHLFAFNVEGRAAETFRDCSYLRRSDVKENCRRIDEAADQPRTGDPVHLWGRARHPNRPTLRIASPKLGFRNQRQAGFGPAAIAARENFRRARAGMTQPRRHALAQLLAFLTNDDGRASGERRGPICDSRVRTANRARDQARIGGEIFVRAHINKRGTVGNADETGKFVAGNRVDRRHDAPLRLRGARYFGCRLMGRSLPHGCSFSGFSASCQRSFVSTTFPSCPSAPGSPFIQTSALASRKGVEGGRSVGPLHVELRTVSFAQTRSFAVRW